MNSKEINKANGIRTVNFSHLAEILEKEKIRKAERIEYNRQYNKQVTAFRKERRARYKEEDRIQAERITTTIENGAATHPSITLQNE
jgi:hypothetical protein